MMSVEDIKSHMQKYSKAFSDSSSPWQTNFDAMAMKTVIRKLVKFLPRSTENLMQAVKHDEHAEICTQGDFVDVDFDVINEEEPKKKKSDEVAEKLNSTPIPTEPSAEPEKPEPLSKENQDFVDSMGGTGFDIIVDNVTVDGFNITNSSYGINCSALGFYIANNTIDASVDGIHLFLHNVSCNMTGR